MTAPRQKNCVPMVAMMDGTPTYATRKPLQETDPQADQDGDDDAEPDLPRVYRRERKAGSGYRQRRGETQIHLPRRDHQREPERQKTVQGQG